MLLLRALPSDACAAWQHEPNATAGAQACGQSAQRPGGSTLCAIRSNISGGSVSSVGGGCSGASGSAILGRLGAFPRFRSGVSKDALGNSVAAPSARDPGGLPMAVDLNSVTIEPALKERIAKLADVSDGPGSVMRWRF
jgi:hypothetical protein